MHTDTDKQIEALIVERKRLELSIDASIVTTPAGAQLASDKVARITEINLQIMKLQGKQAGGNGSAAIDPELAICKTCAKTFSLATGHDCGGLTDANRQRRLGAMVSGVTDARRFAEQVAGIEEKTVWTTKDGQRWDRLEDAIAHQRRKQIIDAIYEADECNAEWLAINAEQIADNAAELFAILEPFFRKGE